MAGSSGGPAAGSRHAPVLLTIPGLCCSGPDHWQTLWEQRLPGCTRIALPEWDDPCPGAWTDAIARALARATQPALLIAHSLGCHALALWAARSTTASDGKVIGALLVAPPDVEAPDADPRVARFAPLAATHLTFPARLVASSNDPYASLSASRRMADVWGAEIIDVGALGHINAQSGLGEWRQGQALAGLAEAP